ncbi:glycerol-3-phosphate dehydrogenase/oxidase [soil metagenome]
MLTRAVSQPWDIVVIGGGATGAGVAVDAATRGYSVLLLEQHDFGKGTSSRSTKLVHGGVRYLERGDIKLVREALHERGRLLKNAPHLVSDQAFVIPSYRWWEAPFYGIGLKLYDALASGDRFGGSRYLNRREVIRHLPTIQRQGLRGGILYHDGQFDDARLLINLIQTAAENGAAVVNYAKVIRLQRNMSNRVSGVSIQDVETGNEYDVAAKVVVNATGAFCDALRLLNDPNAKPMVAPSQGIHLMFDRSFLPGDSALMVPKTPDGRVMFAIPWHGHTLVGTTDVKVASAELEPRATEAEIAFILDTAGRYLAKKPTRADVLSVFAGIRPLVQADVAKNTAALSRDHTIRNESGLLTITGGKWTTYRNMAEDGVNLAATWAALPQRVCQTKTLPIHGWCEVTTMNDPLSVYGSDAAAIRGLNRPERLHAELPYTEAEVIWATRQEMARSVEDVLSRRLRALLLNATAAVAMAPRVATLMATELGYDSKWEAEQVRAFRDLARGYDLNRGPVVTTANLATV